MFSSPKTLSGVIEAKEKDLKKRRITIPKNYFFNCKSITDIEKKSNKLIFESL